MLKAWIQKTGTMESVPWSSYEKTKRHTYAAIQTCDVIASKAGWVVSAAAKWQLYVSY
jgi:hypothetical protein